MPPVPAAYAGLARLAGPGPRATGHGPPGAAPPPATTRAPLEGSPPQVLGTLGAGAAAQRQHARQQRQQPVRGDRVVQDALDVERSQLGGGCIRESMGGYGVAGARCRGGSCVRKSAWVSRTVSWAAVNKGQGMGWLLMGGAWAGQAAVQPRMQRSELHAGSCSPTTKPPSPPHPRPAPQAACTARRRPGATAQKPCAGAALPPGPAPPDIGRQARGAGEARAGRRASGQGSTGSRACCADPQPAPSAASPLSSSRRPPRTCSMRPSALSRSPSRPAAAASAPAAIATSSSPYPRSFSSSLAARQGRVGWQGKHIRAGRESG